MGAVAASTVTTNAPQLLRNDHAQPESSAAATTREHLSSRGLDIATPGIARSAASHAALIFAHRRVTSRACAAV
jgi:hypothetical protein